MALSDDLLTTDPRDLLAHTNRRFWRKLARRYGSGVELNFNRLCVIDDYIEGGLLGQFCCMVLAEESSSWLEAAFDSVVKWLASAGPTGPIEPMGWT